MDFWINLSFYIFGALSYSFMSRLFNEHHGRRIFSELQRVMFSIVATIEVDFRKAVSFKLQNLKEAGIPEEDLLMLEEVDNEIIETWKQTIITRTLIECPKSMQSTREYQAWVSLLDPENSEEEE